MGDSKMTQLKDKFTKYNQKQLHQDVFKDENQISLHPKARATDIHDQHTIVDLLASGTQLVDSSSKTVKTG